MPLTVAPLPTRRARRERIRTLEWKRRERSRLGWYRAGTTLFTQRFQAEHRALRAALTAAPTPRQGMARVLVAVQAQAPVWEKALTRLYRGVAADFGPQALDELEQKALAELEQKALPRSILDWIAGEAATKVVQIQDTTRDQIRTILMTGVEAGESISDMARRLDGLYALGPVRGRAYRIAATETVNAMGASQVLMVAGEGDAAAMKEWLSSRDQAVRDAHRALDGQRVLVTAPFKIEGHNLRWPADSGLGAPARLTVHCFIPTTRLQGAVELALRIKYVGPILQITTAAGHQLTVTPNHPIGTRHGLLPASQLRNGDELLTYRRDLNRSGIADDRHDPPLTIEQTFHALRQQGCPTRREIGRDDLHGDALYGQGQIEIVALDWQLLRDRQLMLEKDRGEFSLISSDAQQSRMHRMGAMNLFNKALTSTKYSLMCGSELLLALFKRHSLPFQRFGLTSSPHGNAGSLKSSNQSRTTHPSKLSQHFHRGASAVLFNQGIPVLELPDCVSTEPSLAIGHEQSLSLWSSGHSSTVKSFNDRHDRATQQLRYLLQGLPGKIQLDRIMNIHEFSYAGYVYDVQAPSGLIIAENIVSSNCRCTLKYSRRELTPLERLREDVGETFPVYETDVVFGEDLGSPGGTTGARMWRGTDGQVRVVKHYADPAQVYAEVAANRIYADLGLSVPRSGFTLQQDKLVLVSDFMESSGTLAKGFTKARALKFLDGYVTDSWLANWDVVGLDLDNVLLAGKQLARVDNGSAFLFRAQGARKAEHLLDQLTEWDGFVQPGLNPSYAKVMKKAGLSTADALGERALGQIAAITKLAAQTDSFATLLPAMPAWVPEADRLRMLQMLRARHTVLLEEITPRLERFLAQQTRVAKGGVVEFAPSTEVLPVLTQERYDALQGRMLGGWVGSSTSFHALKMAAAVRAEFQTEQAIIRGFFPGQVSPEELLEARAFVRRLWQETQDDFIQRKAPKTFKLVRGTRTPEPVRNVIESWSTSRVIGRQFNGHEVMERLKVPRSHVLVSYKSPGWTFGPGEYEYILINRVPLE